MCNWLDAISSGSVSTGTGFRSVAKPDLHSAMLVVKRTYKRSWDCYVLERDHDIDDTFELMSYHFSIIFTHKKLK